MAKATVADIVSHLSSLNITPGKLLTHESSTSPSSWRDALAKSSDVPRSYQLVKSLVFKPKTSKTAPQTLLVVFAREETETSSAALGKKFNLKDLRLAPEDLLNSLFGVNKDASACALMLKSS
jgi:prolyl-tRNA synthetase